MHNVALYITHQTAPVAGLLAFCSLCIQLISSQSNYLHSIEIHAFLCGGGEAEKQKNYVIVP